MIRAYPAFTRRAGAVWLRNLLAWVKYAKSSILLNFGEPVMNLLALGVGLGAYVSQMGGVSFLEFMAPGLLAVTVMNAVAYDITFDGYDRLRSTGVYDAMVTAPLSVEEVVAGELLWEASRAVVYGLIFLVVLFFFGLVRSVWVVFLPIVLVLTGLLFGALGLAVVTVARSHEHLFYFFTLAITPMFMFSGVFFPVERMPYLLQWVVKATPLFHAVELSRALSLGRVAPVDLVYLATLTALTLLSLALPVPLLRRALEK
ncbi:MAG: ABC transporter permease [Chitinophagales bacterium]